MQKALSWGLLGAGTIGQDLLRQVGQPVVAARLGLELRPRFVLRSSGIWQPGKTGELQDTGSSDIEQVEVPAIVFNALPSSGDGRSAELMRHFLQHGAVVVTAEKAALAYGFTELKQLSDNFQRLGINAAVGGGTRPLAAGRSHFQDPGNISQIHMTMNGTVSYISSAVAEGASPAEAVQKAIELGYAEPGASEPAAVFQQELEGDVPKKLAIFMNMMGLGTLISPDELSIQLDKSAINQALEQARERRFIVSLYGPLFQEMGRQVDDDILAKFEFRHDDWLIVGGFRNIASNPLFDEFATLTGPGNCFLVGLGKNEEDGVNVFAKGPGAGANATVNTMLDDYLSLKPAA